MKFAFLTLSSLILTQAVFSAVPADLTPENIENNMKLVAEWQVAHPKRHDTRDWTYGAFFAGMSDYGNMNPDGPGFENLRKTGSEKEWSHFRGPFHADNHAIGQAYLEIATFDKNPAAMKNTQELLDKVIEHDSQVSIEFGKPRNQDRWSWADALFMSPTVFVKMAGYTGDEKYLKFADREYKVTYDYLFDKKEGLFFRDSRYFPDKIKTANGKKMFWSRGNGWVFAGLPILLRDLPKDWPTRKFYEDTFKRMAKALKDSQQPDGSWYPSLLDPADPAIKEMSATNFINYGLIWGINNGYLSEKEYFPVVKKAWEVTCDAISEEGALGWVQPIADKPGNYSANSTEVYASGAFLLTGAELRKYVIRKAHKNILTVSVKNPVRVFRPSETISVKWAKSNSDKLRVFDVRNGRVIDHQIIDEDGDGKEDKLLFQGDLFAGTTREFWIFESDTLPAAKNEIVCYNRHVPERMDDFAWENDVAVFRMYGPTVTKPAPKGEALVSGGIDSWSKKVRTPIIDKFYKNGKYHDDHGEGMDWYKVSTGPGCGGHAFFVGDKLYSTQNWSTSKHLYNGPVRTAFEVTFAPLDLGNGIKVTEKKLVTMDAGSSFFRCESSYTFSGKESGIYTAVGMDMTQNTNDSSENHKFIKDFGSKLGGYSGYASYWTTHSKNGSIGTAIILAKAPRIKEFSVNKDIYLGKPFSKNKPFVSYAGAAWSKAGIFPESSLWDKYCADYMHRIINPVQVTISK